MAITKAQLILSSGLVLSDPVIVISEMNIVNNSSVSERLDITSNSDESAQHYQIEKSTAGGNACSAICSVFMNKAAFDAGKPPVDTLKDGRSTKVFSINLDKPEFNGMTPRQAAYAHMMALPDFDGAVLVDGVDV
ncbi:hypothetical protein ACSMFS_05520 [Shewanella xiamenensis]|uniref:hypothetical protein n=1 Tax=Shewanella xiamenensis TaxID=332186 RepID=UPI003F1E3AC0